VVITGAAGGIGSALARRFAEEGAGAVVVSDLDRDAVAAVAGEIGATAIAADVGSEEGVSGLVAEASAANGPIDVFWSNAGIPGPSGGPEADDQGWDACWRINVMAHIWTARALLPEMLERGEGCLVSTASAAGLTMQVSAMPYTVTKHAAVSVAEWLSVTYADRGIEVSCLCPQAVETPMLDAARQDPLGGAILEAGGVLSPEEAAVAAIDGLKAGRFLLLPHPEVSRHIAVKGADPEKWLEGMRRAVRRVGPVD
jgi:NAD(P)-dependent dehydrogenase (short-subunit alcohol dehydrogenase family)